MAKGNRLTLAFIVLIATILSGCMYTQGNDVRIILPPSENGSVSGETGAQDSNGHQAQMPHSFEQLQMEQLEVGKYQFSRAGETSSGKAWETERGIYIAVNQLLYYADKTDLSKWVVVCPDPECKHEETDLYCGASVVGEVMVYGDRIYKTGIIGPSQETFVLVSTALDGTDQRTEYVFNEVENMQSYGTSAGRVIMTAEYLICCAMIMNPQGTYDLVVYSADESGVVLQIAEEREDLLMGTNMARIGENLWFEATVIHQNRERNIIYSLDDGELVSVDITGLPSSNAYFDGKEMVFFRYGEGYYRLNVNTGAEEKLAEPQLTNGYADVALPNCILESTMHSVASVENRPEHQEMWIFNGSEWQEVLLPDDILNLEQTSYFQETIVTSDRLLLRLVNKGRQETLQLYQILLTTDTPTLEYLGPIG